MANDVEVKIIYTDKESADKLVKGAEKTGKKAGSGLGKALAVGFGAAIGVGALKVLGSALGKITNAFSSSLAAAQVQEDAINSLNSALLVTGKLTNEASQDIQKFASALQQQTKFGDEAILNTAALVQSLANLETKGLKRATAATVDLAAALNIDLASAANIVGKALGGNIGALSRYGVIVKRGATESQTLANVLDALESKFGGTAQQQIKTFSGALQQTKNTFGDLLEQIGFIITKNPIAIKLVKSLGDTFRDAIEQVKGIELTNQLVVNFINDLARINSVIVNNVIQPFVSLLQIGDLVFASLNAGTALVVAGLGKLGSGVSFILNKLGLLKGVQQSLNDFSETSGLVFEENAAKVRAAFDSIGDTSLTDKLLVKNEELREGLAAIVETAKVSNQEVIDNQVAVVDKVAETSKFAASSIGEVWDGLSVKAFTAQKNFQKTSAKIAAVVKNNLVRGVSGGIQNIVNSIANGENAFANFGKFVLQTVGDLAIQLGQTLIGAGIGIEALKSLGGAAAIAAGAGLIALGAIIKSIAGGGGQTTSTSSTGGNNFSGGAGGETEIADDIAEPDQIQEQGPRVSLNIEGNVFDTDDTRRSIVDFLNEEFSEGGASLENASFA